VNEEKIKTWLRLVVRICFSALTLMVDGSKDIWPIKTVFTNPRGSLLEKLEEGWVEQGLTFHQTHYRSYRDERTLYCI